MENQLENQNSTNNEKLTTNQKKMLDVYLHPFFVPLTDYTATMVHLQMQLAAALNRNALLIQQGKRSGYFNRPYGSKQDQQNNNFRRGSKCKMDPDNGLIGQEEPRKVTQVVEIAEEKANSGLKIQPAQPEIFVKGKTMQVSQFDRTVRAKSSHEEQQKADDQMNSKKKQSYYKIKIIIKNFALAIFSFIKINRALKKRVLQKFNIPTKDFEKFIDETKDKIESINDFKMLWTQQGNKYHKVFRILSYKYLSQNCIPQIFLSRVDNNQTHLKYRVLLMESLKNPENITVFRIN